ncbi:MAG: SUMF1/EgtB/PvdO family nonheme iron enzyme, partial [Acidobacteriota bacterium]
VDQVGTERLGSILQAHRHLRLVFLNVCEGGRGDGADPFAGIAQSLLRHGVPSVLAMGASIRDDLAVSFASGFYRSLARSGSIETAAAEARASLFSSSGHRAWATPVFYVRNLGDLDLRTAMAPRRLRRAAPWLAAGLGAALLGGALLRPAAPTEDARCPSPPGVDLDLRLVSEGTFRMGEGEGTLVRVEHDFCLGRTEVTQAVWAKMLGDGADDPSFYRSPDRPVHGVTWRQVRTFVDRLNQAYDDDPFRLPTEVEWEYAARNRGDLDPDLEDDPVWVEAHGNCISTTGNDGYDGVAPVASFAADPGGFYDLRGNVFEWAEEHTEGHGPPRAIAAGGSFESSPDNCRPTHRSPRDSFRVFRDQGFRIARNPLPEDGED